MTTQITTTTPRAPLLALGPTRLSDKAFETVAYLLASTWPRQPLPAATLAIYRALLRHLADDVAIQATIRRCATASFLPTPGELLAEAHAILAERGEGPPTAEAAWFSVLLALKRGSTQPCHRLVRQALDTLGGQRYLSSVTYEQLPYLQRRFEQIYRTLCGRHYLSLQGLGSVLEPAEPPDEGETASLPDPN